MINVYEENIKALYEVDKILYDSISLIHKNQEFEVFQGKDNIDINILDKRLNTFIYQKPLEELKNTLEELEKNYIYYPVLFYYGIGNGLYIKALLQNEALKHLVIVEPNLELIYIALNFIDVSQDIRSEKLIIKLSKLLDFSNTLQLVYKADMKPYPRLYDLHTTSSYYSENFSEDLKTINTLFIKSFKHMVLGYGNDCTDSLIGIEHHIKHIPLMLKNYKTTDIVKKKNSDLAVIVSTGPSLAKQLTLLKKYAPFITIICIDASLPILQKHKIAPDIVVSMERVQLTSMFFSDLDNELLKNTYFVVSSLAHPDTLENLKGQKLLLSMRPLGYMKYYDLKEFGYLGAGMSAANMGHQLAYFMGFDYIALIGQDLAYADDGKSHSKGHIFSENEIEHTYSDLFVPRYGNDGVIKTTLIWDMFKNYFEKEIAEAKTKDDVITYNSTEGGAKINAAIEEPFSEVLKKHSLKSKKETIKIRKVRKDRYKKLLQKAIVKTNEILEYGEKLKSEVEELFLEVSKTCEKLKVLKKSDIDYDKLIKITEKIDIVKESIESIEFGRMYTDTVQSYIYHQELELAKLIVKNTKTEEEKNEKLVKWIEAHQYWLFSLAGGIDAQIQTIKKSFDYEATLLE